MELMVPTPPLIEQINARVCVVGGGPAGVMCGYLLARAGVDVVVLEKHGDFLRDFRGDTVHPSTLEVMWELGLLEGFLARKHQEYRQISGRFNGTSAYVGDFSRLPTQCKFVALMPQWDFLNFLTEEGEKFATFRVLMKYQATDLIVEDGRVGGVIGTSPNGPFEVRAALTIGADGRHSIIRERAGFEIEDLGAPMDVLWMRLPKEPADAESMLGHFKPGKMLVTINRGDYWQCASIIRKGTFDEVQQHGIQKFRDDIGDVAPFLRERTSALRDWNDVSLLTVRVDRLRKWWRPGLLCIGDSAHAMSPVGGIGINLAIQDAVATANICSDRLREESLIDGTLEVVQLRRLPPTKWTQALQVRAHKRVVEPTLAGKINFSPLPLPLRLLDRHRWLRQFPARVIGMGFRPEHVRSPTTGRTHGVSRIDGDMALTLHDNLLISYEVRCDLRTISLRTERRVTNESTRFVNVIFEGVQGYRFENDAFGNIILDLETVAIDRFLVEHRAAISESYRMAGAPGPWAANLETAPGYLRERGIQAFILISSIGLSGWVLAREMSVLAAE